LVSRDDSSEVEKNHKSKNNCTTRARVDSKLKLRFNSVEKRHLLRLSFLGFWV
jgi:hypothetical protein